MFLVLSPLYLSLVLSPLYLSLVLSPLYLSLVLSPLYLHPLVLSPLYLHSLVLSPLYLSLILSSISSTYLYVPLFSQPIFVSPLSGPISSAYSHLCLSILWSHCCKAEKDNNADGQKYNLLLFFLLSEMYVWVEWKRVRNSWDASTQGWWWGSFVKPLCLSGLFSTFHKTGTEPPQGIRYS